MRVFIALEFDDVVKSKLSRITHEVTDHVAGGRFYLPCNFHLTLRFIGELVPKDEDSACERLKTLMTHVASQTQPFTYTVDGLGTFPKKNRHILWAAISSGESTLQDLANRLELGVQSLGYGPSTPSSATPNFTPHITLGRGISFRETSDFHPVGQEHHHDPLPLLNERVMPLGIFPFTVTADRLTLMESQQVEGVLRYVPLFSAPFAKESRTKK